MSVSFGILFFSADIPYSEVARGKVSGCSQRWSQEGTAVPALPSPRAAALAAEAHRHPHTPSPT